MSFWTSLLYCRPTAAPIITGDDLARFIVAFDEQQVTKRQGSRSMSVKFGEAIDQDDKPSEWIEWYESLPTMGTTAEIEWDIDHLRCASLAEAAGHVAGRAEHVYRAFIELGGACESIQTALQVESQQNSTGLRVGSWGLHAGVITACHMGEGKEFHVGWLALSLSGQGYCFPNPRRDMLRDAADHPDVRKAAELCRRTWPIPPTSSSWRLRRRRKQMGELWPHIALDLPVDWYWTMEETG